MRKSTLKSAKAKLWKTISEYIRRRDQGVCFTCGKKDDWRNTDCGHYIPRSAGLSTFFEIRNLHCQCTGCNRFRHGNLTAYALALKRKYGPDILEELDARRRQVKKYSVAEYQALIKEYTELLKTI